ncbi:unnamed protein product [Amoebophrya sp. A120]|nr:unnamed protein product [Amoebophrya sp. A120]|eukprot:GSA120T00002770001.1
MEQAEARQSSSFRSSRPNPPATPPSLRSRPKTPARSTSPLPLLKRPQSCRVWVCRCNLGSCLFQLARRMEDASRISRSRYTRCRPEPRWRREPRSSQKSRFPNSRRRTNLARTFISLLDRISAVRNGSLARMAFTVLAPTGRHGRAVLLVLGNGMRTADSRRHFPKTPWVGPSTTNGSRKHLTGFSPPRLGRHPRRKVRFRCRQTKTVPRARKVK